MDRGFYSEANVNFLYKNHRRFLMGMKNNLLWIQKEIKKVKSTINSWENYIEQYSVYAQTSMVKWEYKENGPIKKDVFKKSKRMYVHVYYNKGKKSDEEIKLIKLKRELESWKKKPRHEKEYSKYFKINKSKKIM